MRKSILILFFYLIGPQCYAFTFNTSSAAAFSNPEVSIVVADGACDEIGITPTELAQMLTQASEQYWNKAPTSRLKLKVDGVVAKPAAFFNEALCSSISATGCIPNANLISSAGIVVACNSNTSVGMFSSTGILALSAPNNVNGRQIVSSLILINNAPQTSFATKDRSEQIAVLAHELGHAIGLGHSPVTDSLMFFRSVPTRRNLGGDDVDGVSYLYPDSIGSSTCGSMIPLIDPTQHKKHQTGVIMLFMLSLIIAQMLKLVPSSVQRFS
jgi:hypothetical protein